VQWRRQSPTNWFSAIIWVAWLLNIGLLTKRPWVQLPFVFLSSNNSRQVVHSRVPHSQSSVIWYQSVDWKVTITVHYRLCGLSIYGLNGLDMKNSTLCLIFTAITFLVLRNLFSYSAPASSNILKHPVVHTAYCQLNTYSLLNCQCYGLELITWWTQRSGMWSWQL